MARIPSFLGLDAETLHARGVRIPTPFKLAPADLSYAEHAEHVFDNEALIDAPAEDVFEVFEGLEHARRWIPHFLLGTWATGDRGSGAVLEEVFRFMKIRLRIVAREPGRRWVAYVEACSLPLASRMLEDVQFTPTAEGKTIFRWRVYYTLLPVARPFHPVVRPFFSKLFREATDGLADYMHERTVRARRVAAV